MGGLSRRDYLFKVYHCRIVELDREGKSTWVVSDDKYRPGRKVACGNETEEVNERDPLLHELTESLVYG